MGVALTLEAQDSVTCQGDRHRTSNQLGPNLTLALTPPPLTDNAAISLFVEGGRKNYRLSGTLGFFASEAHRFKFSGEQLCQRLNYRFVSGEVPRWVSQYAVGGIYQYCLEWSFIDSLEIFTSYSKAQGHSLSAFTCLTDPVSVLNRRIAGGKEGHIGAGATLLPWHCARLAVSFDYDRVRYDHRFGCGRRISGWGGSVGIQQGLPCDLELDFKAEFRRPFYYYGGGLCWKYSTYNGKLSVGLYASHTNGRSSLPNNSVCGLYLGYAFGGGSLFGGYYPGTTCSPDWQCCSCGPCDSDLIAWVAKPAVCMPIVVAIGEQEFEK